MKEKKKQVTHVHTDAYSQDIDVANNVLIHLILNYLIEYESTQIEITNFEMIFRITNKNLICLNIFSAKDNLLGMVNQIVNEMRHEIIGSTH